MYAEIMQSENDIIPNSARHGPEINRRLQIRCYGTKVRLLGLSSPRPIAPQTPAPSPQGFRIYLILVTFLA